MRHPTVLYTSQVVYKSTGWKRHLNRGDGYTLCRKVMDASWRQSGDANPPSNNAGSDYWCRKCFPDSFVLVAGTVYNLAQEAEGGDR